MTAPVTVSVRREIAPSLHNDAVIWIDQGLSLARKHTGCLSAGVMRDIDNEHVLHVVYQFNDERALAAWEHSSERARWLRAGKSLILDASVQRRTGIEGWFDGPQLRSTVDSTTGTMRTIGVRSAPVRWKQAVAIWIAMIPLNIVLSTVVSTLPWWGDLAIPVRSVITVSTLVPIMTFFMMPTVTRILRPWLRRNPGMIKSERSLLEALDSRTPLN